MTLTLEQREVLMYLACGKGYKEIRHILGLGELAVRKRLQRARQANQCDTTYELMFRYGVEMAK